MQGCERAWNFPPASSDASLELGRTLGVSQLVSDVMVGRGIKGECEARRFLEPSGSDFSDPFQFPAMEEACARVHRGVREGEKIVVYGDYDVDGMTASTLLYWVLKKLGASVEVFIPDRHSAGYGLNCDAIRALREAGTTLIITVDNGVSATREIAFAAELGVSVIVTDHHTLPDELPRHALLLHPRLPGREYPFPHLCGAGVAFKLGLALLATSTLDGREEVRERFARNCLDVVTIGTVADMVPLVGENRAIVRHGLCQLARTEHPGLRALLGLEQLVGRRLTVDHVGFKICPKLNSAGRIDDHRLSLELLTTRDESAAGRLALKLAQINHERIRLVTELMKLALEKAPDWADRALPVVSLPTDKKGLVGLVAQRLKDSFHKPFLVLAAVGNAATGSGRSVDGFDLVAALSSAGSHLMRFGGHAMAVGFTIDPARVEAFADSLEAYAVERLVTRPDPPPVEVSAVVEPSALTQQTLAQLDRLAPFGQGNPSPLLALRRLQVSRADRIGDGKHVRLESSVIPRGVKNVGFNLGDAVMGALEQTSYLDVAFHFELDNWNGRESLQMRLQAVRPAI
ncbi:MAG: single-stranded-DNA-specific exonuclease RecJ [Candidatus Wallbacteria bacterium]|nr:single-stranded-DNA-specific exonuclease RecJ [Candidatus Wallbacteria bacterium]